MLRRIASHLFWTACNLERAEWRARLLDVNYHLLIESPPLWIGNEELKKDVQKAKVLPQKISVPIPAADDTTLKDGETYYSKLSDNFFTPNEFPPCGVNITSVKIMNESETDVR